MHSQYDKHKCKLKKQTHPGALPLAPNAMLLWRFLSFLRKATIMNMGSRKSKMFFRNKALMRAELKRCAKDQRFFIVHPFSKVNIYLETMMFLIWSCNFITISLYDVAPLANIRAIKFIFYDLFNGFQFIIIVLLFFVGYVDEKKKEIIITPKKIILRYLTTYFFFDYLAVGFPDTLRIFFDVHRLFRECWWCGISIMFVQGVGTFARFKSIIDILNRFMTDCNIGEKASFVIFHTYMLTIILNAATGLAFHFSRAMNHGYFPPESWVYQAFIEGLPEKSDWSIYCRSILVVICYFFGVFHGFYVISLPSEDLFLALLSLFGRIYTLFLLARLLMTFGIVTVSESKYEQVISQVNEYMNSTKMPAKQRSRLLKFYEYKLQKRYFNEKEIISTLTEQLRTEIFLFGARRLIEKVPVLKALPAPTLAGLFAEMKSEIFLVNDIITKSGDPLTNFYFISSGTVAVVTMEGLEITHLVDGEEFGFVSLWTSQSVVQRYNFIAAETTNIYYVNKAFITIFFGNHKEVMEYFERRARARERKFAQIEINHKRGGADFLTELRKQTVLERQTPRTFNFE